VAADPDDSPEAADERPLDPRWAALSELHPDR
jgi:hypothetical protein